MEGAQQIPLGDAQAGPLVSVDAAAFAAKYQSKRKVYRFLTHDCGVYLSSYESMTVWHMRDIVSGKRKRINQTDVKTITVPHFEGLNIERMLAYAADKVEVMYALPTIEREREKLPRAYVANVIYTLVGDAFKQWVEKKVNDRHQLRREPQDAIQLDPEIAAIYNASLATSGK